ncbi:uncharacterized protein TNCV_3218711 [Trichonephila clavipes]|nr:uncharacterized protein TNCV_3218711 [Trichonephila clavipes]
MVAAWSPAESEFSRSGFEDFMQSVAKSKTVQEQWKFIVDKKILEIQQLYSQNKCQKPFTPSMAFRYNYQCLKYKYIKDYLQALARSAQQPKLLLIVGRLFPLKSTQLCNGQNKTNSVSASDSLFIGLTGLSRKIRLPLLLGGYNVLLQAVILAPDEGGVETSWKSAGGTDAGKAIGSAGAQMLVKILERLLDCQVIYSQFGLAIHQNDHQARRRFVEWAQNEIAVVPDFHNRILFSDEAHFWLNGYVNKQNCRIWSEANPQVYVETPLHPEKLTVWCALWAGGILLQKR